MRRILALAVLAAAALSAHEAQAQRYQGSSDNPIGPTVSPYLNLLNSNDFGVTNYQSLVRPLVQQGNALNRQAGAINRLQQQMSTPRGYGGATGATGHATFFMNYGHYYQFPSR